jgi:hypothetical protein
MNPLSRGPAILIDINDHTSYNYQKIYNFSTIVLINSGQTAPCPGLHAR